MNTRLLGIAALTIPLGLAGCGGGGSGETTTTVVTYSYPPSIAQSITGFQLPALSVGENTTATATATSGFPVTFASTTPAVCKVSGDTVTAISTGTCTITAAQAGDPYRNIYKAYPVTYNAAPTLTLSTTITPASTARVERAELAPWLLTAQAGSTNADAATILEGLYVSPTNPAMWAAIDGAANLQYADDTNHFFGNASATASTFEWSGMNALGAGTLLYFTARASGNFVAKTSLTAITQSANFVTTPSLFTLNYAPSNGYAASAASVAGNWMWNDGHSLYHLAIGTQGQITGTESDSSGQVCTLTGSITQSESGSQHNLYTMSLNASGATCGLNYYGTYQGLAAIDFMPAGSTASNGYYPVLRVNMQDLTKTSTTSNTLAGPATLSLQFKNTAIS